MIVDMRIGAIKTSMDVFTVAVDMVDIINRVTETAVFILWSEVLLMK